MEDAENLILSQIRLLKAMFQNFSAENVDEEIAKCAESELEDVQNYVLEIAADITGLLREYGGEDRIPTREYRDAGMPIQRKEWWKAQKKSIFDEFKAHERLVKAAVNDKNIARKEDYEVVEKVKDDLDNVQLSEINQYKLKKSA